jgi:hypothetical protein
MGYDLQGTDAGDPKYGASFVYYGVAEDAKMAAEIYDDLRLLIASMAVAKWGTIFKGDGAAYAEGFVMGLIHKHGQSEIEAKKIATDSTSMVLIARRDDLIAYKQDKSKDWLKKEKGIKLGKGSQWGGSSGSRQAHNEGFQDGQNTDVSNTKSKKLA